MRAQPLLAERRDGTHELHDERRWPGARRARAGSRPARSCPWFSTTICSADLHGLLLVVGHEDGGHVHLVVEPAQPCAQLLAHRGVERAERLVEQQHLGLDRQRPRERHALALPARELGRDSGLQAVQVHELRAARSTRASISCFGRLRIFSPKATLSRTVMCLKAA